MLILSPSPVFNIGHAEYSLVYLSTEFAAWADYQDFEVGQIRFSLM